MPLKWLAVSGINVKRLNHKGYSNYQYQGNSNNSKEGIYLFYQREHFKTFDIYKGEGESTLLEAVGISVGQDRWLWVTWMSPSGSDGVTLSKA